MPDFEMPYFIDGGGNKGYFKDSTARDQIETANDQIATLTSEKVTYIPFGTITASSVTEALGKVWDSITVYSRTVIVSFGWYGTLMAMMYKYPDSQYGMAIAMRYASTDIYTMNVNNGTKSYATYSSESGTVTSTLFDTNRIAVTSQNIKYQKSGNIVTVYGDVTFGAKVTTSGNYINANRLPFISNIQSIVSGKIICGTGSAIPYEAVSQGGTSSIWFSYGTTYELQTTYFENKTFHLYLSYIVS